MSAPAPHWTTRVYPAAYRREYAAEISAVIANVTANEGRRAGALEKAGVLGHALRLRTGLDSSRPGGRFAAGLLPFVIPVAAALSLTLLTVWRIIPLPWDGRRSYTPLAYGPWLVVLGCALAGRWVATRAAAVLALLGAAVSLPLARWTDGPAGLAENLPTAVGLGAAALVVLAAPPDLPPTGGAARRAMALIAFALGAPMLVGSVMVFQAVSGAYTVTDARVDPMHLFTYLMPVVLAVPAAVAMSRSRYGAALAALLIVGSVLVFLPTGLLAEVPFAAGGVLAEVVFGTGILALALYAVRGIRERRRAAAG